MNFDGPLRRNWSTQKLASNCQLLLLISIIITNFPSIQSTSKEFRYDSHATSGAYLEQQDISLYDTVAPLIFKLKKPDWLGQSPLFLGYPCNSDKYAEATLCPVFYYMHKQMSAELQNLVDVPSMSLPISDMEVIFDCDEVSKHFDSFRISETRMEEYIEKLRKCTERKLIITDLNANETKKEKFRSSYDKMMSRFMEEFHNHLPTSSRENKAAELNNRLALTSIVLTHMSALSDQWSNALSECKSGFIPESLISPAALLSGLESIEKIVTDEVYNFKLSLPYSGPLISQYYKAPLADCVMTKDLLYLRVLVPVVRKRKTPATLIKIKSIPFHAQDDHHKICMIAGFEHGRYFNLGVQEAGSISVSMAMEVTCDTSNFHLCKIPPPLDSVVDAATDCARAVITNDHDKTDETSLNVVNACKLECNLLDKEKLPIVVKARDHYNTVFVMMNPESSENIYLECEKKDDSQGIKAPNTGVLAIRIPCKCKLVLKEMTISPVLTTCSPVLTVVNVLPYHWDGQNTVK